MLTVALGLGAAALTIVLAIASATLLPSRGWRGRRVDRPHGDEASGVQGEEASGAQQAGKDESLERGEDRTFRFERSFVVANTRAGVWDLIWDIPTFASCIPGCYEVQELERHRSYDARIRKKLGPFLIRLSLTIEIIAYEERDFVTSIMTGHDHRLRSGVTQQVELRLSDDERGCRVSMGLIVTLDGVLAKLDRHLIEANLDHTIDTFVERLSAALSDNSEAEAEKRGRLTPESE